MFDLSILKTLTDNNQFSTQILALIPELSILFGMLAALLSSLFPKFAKNSWIVVTPFILVSLTFCIVLFKQLGPADSIYVFAGAALIDQFALLLKGLMFFVLLCLNLGAGIYLNNEKFVSKGEFQFLLLGATLGASFLVSANDFILLFVALETLSLSSIAMIAYARQDVLSGEAAVKYLLNGAVASACLIFAISLLYGITLGNTSLSAFPNLFVSNPSPLFSKQMLLNFFPIVLFALAMFLTIAAVAFKLSLAPFHFWAPDVYHGANLPATAFISTISKIAALGLFCRVGWTVFASNPITFSSINSIGSIPFYFNAWNTVFAILAILSMIIGNLVGAQQIFRHNGSLKRLFAYSSIAQIGYIMTGIVLGPDWTAVQSFMYLIIYVLTNLGVFLCLIKVEDWYQTNQVAVVHPDSIEALKGFFQVKPKTCVFLAVCIANLAAVLPAMLIAKLALIEASLRPGMVSFFDQELLAAYGLANSPYLLKANLCFVMAIAILLTSVISIFYYASLIKKIFVEKPYPAVLDAAKKIADTQRSEVEEEMTKPTKSFRLAHSMLNFACVLVLLGVVHVSLFLNFWMSKVTSGAVGSLYSSSVNNLFTALNLKQPDQFRPDASVQTEQKEDTNSKQALTQGKRQKGQ